MVRDADFNGLLARICKETGKSESEVLKLIEEKKSRFFGLLTNSGAAFMVAKEQGISTGVEKRPSKSIKINSLSDKMNGLNLLVRVLHIYSPKEYEKNNVKGQYMRLLVGDEAGEISLTLWGDDVKKIQEKKVERGAVLRLNNAFVSTYKEQLQLGVSRKGGIEINPIEENTGMLPKPEKIAIKISDLGEGMENIDIFARIVRVFELNEFQREGETRKVVNCIIGDGTGTIRATGWNELAEAINRVPEGTVVKIEGAYTKNGLKGIELHLGWNSRIIENPVIGFIIPEVKELSSASIEKKLISELKEGKKSEVLATIVGLNKGKLLFATCPKCGGRVEGKGDAVVCGKCGQLKEVKNKLVLTAAIDDGSDSINATLFGRNAETVLGILTQEVEKKMQELTAGEVIGKIAPKTIGKQFVFTGSTKKNEYRDGELELRVSAVREANSMEHAKQLAEKIKV